MAFKLSKGEFGILVDIQSVISFMDNQINTYKPFFEDPAGLYEELDDSIVELTKKIDLLKKLNAVFVRQNLRG